MLNSVAVVPLRAKFARQYTVAGGPDDITGGPETGCGIGLALLAGCIPLIALPAPMALVATDPLVAEAGTN